MTQEQRINRGSIVIFILSIVLILCLTVTATLAYFAGDDTSSTTLVIGGPVTVKMFDGDDDEEYGAHNLVMGITDSYNVRPGMGVDIRTSARVYSSNTDPNDALLRAVININVESTGNPFVSDSTLEMVKLTLPQMIVENMMTNLYERVDSTQVASRDGWVYHDGAFYYCSQDRDEDGDIVLKSIITNADGQKIQFMDGIFLLPTTMTNDYSCLKVTITLTFQAIQSVLFDDNGREMKNTISNVKSVLDAFTDEDWDNHNGL